MEKGAKFYITTPIYYVNARPHIGHAYTTIVCDVLARRQRMLGSDTFFLTGTDEHGQKIERSAAAAGKSPKQWTDVIAGEYRALWDRMGISYDGFIRTTDKEHEAGVQEFFRQIRDRGYIYKGSYTGQYCVYDELYVDAPPGSPCPDCGRPTETISEENYYFKLSEFQDKLLKLYEDNPEFIWPATRRNEVIAFVRGGLKDLSISRTTVRWGIPVPDDPAHVLYVWFDADANYITAIGYGAGNAKAKKTFERYWPADVHMVGKEIVRFHAVYWPAFLMAAALPLPKRVVVHGWLLFEQDKMSKSRGNIVRAETVLDVLGSDALRYFLLREVVFGQDGSFSFDALVQRYNSDLANDLGNLSSRTLSMIARYFREQIPYPSAKAARTASDDAIGELAEQVIRSANELFAGFQLSRALESVWSLVSGVNKYIVENEPWQLGEQKDETSLARLATVLYTSAEALRITTALLHPVLPVATARIWSQLGLGDIAGCRLDQLKWGELKFGTKLGKIEPVFPRAEKNAVQRMQQAEHERASGATASTTVPVGTAKTGQLATQAAVTGGASPTPVGTSATTVQRATEAGGAGGAPSSTTDGRITIDDFTKVELRVGEVKTAEKVKGADKLLKLQVDIGSEVRTIVAGIAEKYAPEKIIGMKVVIVANLQPRKLRGIESNGMIVAASIGEKGLPVLASFLEDVPVGARLK
ncbi:MAG TPA: methionine--tRNA ligase [Terriglobales bacterium]|nr:methionine--tRNA ligase [Terriglobales bacterium]